MQSKNAVHIRCPVLCTIKLCRMRGSIYLFKVTGMLTSGNVKLKRNRLWGHYRIRLERGQHDIEWK